jgi:DHA2 family multidrug resistance protein
MSITLSGLTPDRIPAASGLSNFARITAGSFGTSISTTLWDDRATLHHAHLVEQLGSNTSTGPFGEVWSQLSAAGFSPEQIAAQINRMIDQQAFTRAADDVFFGSAFLFVVLIGMIWFAKPAKAGGGGAPADGGGAH